MSYEIENEFCEWFVFARLKYSQLTELHEAYTAERDCERPERIEAGWQSIFDGLGEATMSFMTNCLVDACGRDIANKLDEPAFDGATIEQSIGDYLTELCEDILSMADIPVLNIVEEFELWLGELQETYGEKK